VTPSLVDTTAACKRRFPPVRRQCYFEDEVTLTHFPPELDYRSGKRLRSSSKLN
jgi:hypothetical protein